MNYKNMNKIAYIILFCVITFLSCKKKSKVETPKIVEPTEVVEQLTASENKSTPRKWIIASNEVDNFEINELPFLFEVYYKDNIPETIYPSYKISKDLDLFLKKNNYEGEEYECFLLPSINNYNLLLISVLRGDSNYYLVLIANSDEIKDMKEIGHIGDESDIRTFDITKDYTIKEYKGFRDSKVLLKTIKITRDGKFSN